MRIGKGGPGHAWRRRRGRRRSTGEEVSVGGALGTTEKGRQRRGRKERVIGVKFPGLRAGAGEEGSLLQLLSTLIFLIIFRFFTN